MHHTRSAPCRPRAAHPSHFPSTSNNSCSSTASPRSDCWGITAGHPACVGGSPGPAVTGSPGWASGRARHRGLPARHPPSDELKYRAYGGGINETTPNRHPSAITTLWLACGRLATTHPARTANPAAMHDLRRVHHAGAFARLIKLGEARKHRAPPFHSSVYQRRMNFGSGAPGSATSSS